MNIPEELYPLFKSLYRYHLFQIEKYPEILIEKEKEIMSKRIAQATPHQLWILTENWETWKTEYCIETEKKDAEMFQQIEKEIQELN